MSKKLVVIESPWAGLDAGQKAQSYLRNCIRDSLARDEVPMASHAMLAWTNALDESDPEQRAEGLEVGKQYIMRADLVVLYVDKGISQGMKEAKTFAIMHGKKVEIRTIFS